MDSSLVGYDKDFRLWNDEQKKELKLFIESIANYTPKEIAIVGSRVQGRHLKRSDLDVVIFTDEITEKNRKDNAREWFNGIKVIAWHWPYKDINRKFRDEYDLPKYLLYKNEFIPGKDVEKWHEHRLTFSGRNKNGKNT